MKMELEKIGSRHRDSTNHFAAESEALDQIAKEVSEFDSKLYFQQLNWVEFIIFNLSKKNWLQKCTNRIGYDLSIENLT